MQRPLVPEAVLAHHLVVLHLRDFGRLDHRELVGGVPKLAVVVDSPTPDPVPALLDRVGAR